MATMKRPFLVVSSVLLIVCLLGVFAGFSTPLQVTAKVPLVKYQQTGKFDYVALLKPSYLFGPEPEKPPPPLTNPKYPVESTKLFQFTFGYAVTADDGAVEVTERVETMATGTDRDGKPMTMSLGANSTQAGPAFSVPFEFTPPPEMMGRDVTISVTVVPTITQGGARSSIRSHRA